MMSFLNTHKYLLKTSRNAIGGYRRWWLTRDYRSVVNSQTIHRPIFITHSVIDGHLTGSCYLPAVHPILRSRDSKLNCTTGQNGNLMLFRQFHVSTVQFEKEPARASSKVEETVNLLKEKSKDESKAQVAPKKPLSTRIMDELKHYYHGFRLLFIDMNISRKLAMKALHGETLTRREHRLLVRTTADIFRLLPFSVFIIVPFMELLLPVFIKFFPGMLPSTFETASAKEDKMKQALKVKLEMAKFLQQTLDDMAVQAKDNDHSSKSAKEFAEFIEKMRTSTEPVSNQDIIKFSKLFEDEITLDSLSRPQLIALCRVLEIQPIGTNNFLVFQLRMKLRSLAADDKMIQQEGTTSLTISELQQACRVRGMRAYGMSEQRLRSQLEQWLDLSLNEKVPPSLLLLSRALLLPETVPTSDQLKATISSLPDTVITQTKAVLGEREGKTDNLTRIEVLKEEQRKIQEELDERKEELDRKAQEEKEILLDPAKAFADTAKPVESFTDLQSTSATSKTEELTASDMETLEDALDSLSNKHKKMIVEKEELEDLKEEMADYQEDLQDLQHVMNESGEKEPEVAESKAARRLFSRVNKMINNMEAALLDIEKKKKEEVELASDRSEQAKEEVVRIDELVSTIRQIQKVPDSARLERLADALAKLDDDKDGSIAVDDLLKMIELIGNEESIKLSTKQIDELALLLKREETLLLEDQIERAIEKHNQATKPNESDSKTKGTSRKESKKPPSSPESSSGPPPSSSSVSAKGNGKHGASPKQVL